MAAPAAQALEQVVRVAGDAVPADAGARVEGHEAVRLGGRGPRDLDRVEAELAARRRPSRSPTRCSRRGRCSRRASSSRRPPARRRRAPERPLHLRLPQRHARTAVGGSAHDPRHVFLVERRLPGSMRSGENATNTSRPGRSPRSASGWTSSSRVVPDVRRAGEHDRLIAPSLRTAVAQAARDGPQVGASVSSTGVGTQITTASADVERTGIRREREPSELDRRLEALPFRAGKVHGPLAHILQPPLAHVDPDHPRSLFGQPDAGREADITQPEDRHGRQRLLWCVRRNALREQGRALDRVGSHDRHVSSNASCAKGSRAGVQIHTNVEF